MNSHWNMDYLGVMADMAGCLNRCRHCWLGSHRNGTMSLCDFRWIAEQFKDWRDENGEGIRELGFFTWWREPDYRDDYRTLWQLEQELSSPGRAERFELLSVWRLARDEHYAKWAAGLPPKACQISFFGMVENTDWGTRRKGSFRDNLLATERLLKVGIVPRWQLFLTKRCMEELNEFTQLIYDLKLHKRCEAVGGKFEVFINGMSPEGNGYELIDFFIDEDDIARIPSGLIEINRDGIDRLGQSEYLLLDTLLRDNSPPNTGAAFPCVSINADYNVYPNIAEPTEWWRLGNLKTDGVDAIIKAYRDETTPGMKMNRKVPVSELARRYGNPNGKKLYNKTDLICRFMHQWGVEYMEGKNNDQ